MQETTPPRFRNEIEILRSELTVKRAPGRISPRCLTPRGANSQLAPMVRPVRRVHLALVVVQFSYGTLPVASKLVFDELSPYGLAWFRMIGAALLFFAMASAAGIPRIAPRDLAKMAGVGLLGMFANQVLFLMGLARTTAVNASVLLTTIPVFTLLIATLLRHESLDRHRALGMAIAFIGVASLLRGFRLGSETLSGDLLVIANAAAFASFLVLSKPLVQKYGSTIVVGVAFATATVAAAPFGAPALIGALPELSLRAYGLMAFILIVPTMMTYLLNAWALRRAPSSTVAVYIYLQPVIGTILAVTILHETLAPQALLSALGIFAGVYLVVSPRPGGPERIADSLDDDAPLDDTSLDDTSLDDDADDDETADSPASAAPTLSTSS